MKSAVLFVFFQPPLPWGRTALSLDTHKSSVERTP